MRRKIGDVSRWEQVTGLGIELPGKKRVVKLEVNVEMPTSFMIEDAGKTTLLAAVEPVECPCTLEFVVQGDCLVIPASEGGVWWYTDDGQTTNFQITTESFTKLEQRMELTPELELEMAKAEAKRLRRLAEQARLLLAKRQRDEAAAEGADPETGEIDDGPQEPADNDQGTPEPSEAGGDSPASE